MLDKLIEFWSSLKLTVVCLVFALVLVFAGTLAQVEMGLWRAQNEYFRSFFVFWTPAGSGLKIPVLPGGYLVGGVLLINLIAAHLRRFAFSRKKAGIWLVHVGLIVLLVGQLLTDALSRESAMQLFEGETKNYSEDFRGNELAIIDQTDPKTDTVFAIPERLLRNPGETIKDMQIPFAIRVKKHWANAVLVQPGSQEPPNAIHSGATAGLLKDVKLMPLPPVTDTERRSTPTAVVELIQDGKSLGDFLVSSYTTSDQNFTAEGRRYNIMMRFTRHYYPFSLTLLKATHEKYKGTEIPKNFASRVQVRNPSQNEQRETVIYMNNPLRYSGNTFYQYQMSAGEMSASAGASASSTLQVVRNPGWLTPYVSTVLISAGLLLQFAIHLFGFLKRKAV